MVAHQGNASGKGINGQSARGHSGESRSTSGKSSKTTAGQSSVPKNAVSTKHSQQPSKDGTAQKAAQDIAGLKDYQLGDCLGKGAFGSVYRALNWGTGETVAVKQVRLADLPKTELRVIMLEIDLLKNLNHPNIVKYHGFVKTAESLYIILEYCENGSLHSICKNFGKFPENLVALYMSQVLHGLLYLHEQGVIHRDIKGANILTTKEGLVKLADFGVATRTTGIHESSVVGTPYWMAPEVIELNGATTASDIWSLGCTVIELLEGKPPYHNLQPMPALFRIVNDDHPPLPESASPAVRDFLMQCFQKDPNLRVSARKLLKHPWIVSAKRADSVIPIKPTKYDEAVNLVQQWNEALKSPNNGTLKRSTNQTMQTQSPLPPRKQDASTPARSKLPVQVGKQVTATDMYRSPDDKEDDNWDDDFATASISPSVLQLPRLKQQDNLVQQTATDKLKAFAANSIIEEEDNWDDNFEGDFVVKTPLQFASSADPLETVRPFPSRISPPSKNTVNSGQGSLKRPSSRSSQPATQVLRGASGSYSGKPKSAVPSRPFAPFRENSVEDYSDLVATDEQAFQQRLNVIKARKAESFSPKLFDPSDFSKTPSSRQPSGKIGGSMRGYDRPASEEKQRDSIRRTQSSVEIQKYAEDVDDEDFSDLLSKDSMLQKPDSDSGSEMGTLMMLNSKLSNNSWLGDDEDEDDPFAQLEEGFDEMDLETNVARDKHARLCSFVEELVGSLKTSQPDDVLEDISEQLMQVLFESPDIKNTVISSHGMLPILEILESCPRRNVIIRLLKILNMIILDNVELQENICFVGGIPIITKFAHKKYPSDIRLEAAAFVRQMYQTSTLTLQMFVSCGGLKVLVDFLEEDYEAERDLVLIGVNGIWNVFLMQSNTPKNDFCRILSRSSTLYPLSLVLNRVLDEEGELAEVLEGRIVNIFLLFSQAENHVKELVAERMVLKRVLKDLRRMRPQNQITMLKFIKNLSMLATTLETLQNSNAIEVLLDLLSSSAETPQYREIANQVVNIMFNLCRLSKTRQEDAALNGAIPLLQRIAKTERPLKEFAYPILCDMAHSGNVGRKILWQNKGLHFYIDLLADPYWQVTALDAIFVWLQEETAKVEEHLLRGSFSQAIVDCFVTSKADAFENLLEPLQKLLRLSPPVAASLSHPELFSRTAQKLGTKKAVVRLNLLRIVRSICDASEEQGALIPMYGLYDAIQRLAEHDSAILVREMASDLIKSSNASVRRSIDGTNGLRNNRRSSSSTMTPPTPLMIHTTSMQPPGTPRSAQPSGYFDLSLSVEPTRSRSSAVTPLSATTNMPYRPASRDGGSSGYNGWTPRERPPSASSTTSTNGVPPNKAVSKLPRTSGKLGRPSTSSEREGSLMNKREGVAEQNGPTAARSAAYNQRRRRQTSGAESRY